MAAPEPRRARSQTWILAALLVAVGLCAALWKALGLGDRPTQTIEIEEKPTEAAPTASPVTPELPPAAGGQHESIASTEPPVAAAPPAEVEPKIRLFGSILDGRDRTPITGDGRVRIADEEWEEQTLSEPIHGGYEFADLHPGGWELTVEVPGFQTLRTRVLLDRDEKEKQVDLVLLPALVVKVRVEAAGPEKLLMTPFRDSLNFTGLRRDAARAASTSEERWLAWSSPESLNLQVVPTLIEPGKWLDGDSERASRIGRFVARATVSPDGTHREVERLRALGYATVGDRRTRRLPDGSSLDEMPVQYCGILEMSEPPPAFASLVLHDCVLRTSPIPAGADEVAFSLSRDELRKMLGRVKLKVADADSGAVPDGLAVSVEQVELNVFGTPREADGAMVFANLWPGPAKVTIHAPDRASIVERILVQPGSTTDLGTYRLQRLASIEVRVVDEKGEPADALFNVFPSDRFEATRTTLADHFFRSDREGVLRIGSVGRGQYFIVAHDESWISFPVLADTDSRRKDPIEIRVTKGTSVVLRLRADPPPNGRFAIRTRSGLPVADRACRTRDAMRFQLAPGDYSVELSDGENWLWSEGLSVGAEPVRRYLPR